MKKEPSVAEVASHPPGPMLQPPLPPDGSILSHAPATGLPEPSTTAPRSGADGASTMSTPSADRSRSAVIMAVVAW